MSTPYVILITGFPGTGKTTLGKALSAHLKAPFYSKDAFKEIVFDTLGSSDQAWSRKVSGTAHRIIDHIIAEELGVGRGVILESNFKRDIDSVRFKNIQKKYSCPIVQILCWAEGDVLADRFLARQQSNARHPGHVIEISDQQVREDLAPGKCETLDIDTPLLELDTTHLDTINYSALFEQVTSLLRRLDYS